MAEEKRTDAAPAMRAASERHPDWRRHLDASAAWVDLTGAMQVTYRGDGLRLSGPDAAATKRAMLLARRVLGAHGYQTEGQQRRTGEAVVTVAS